MNTRQGKIDYLVQQKYRMQAIVLQLAKSVDQEAVAALQTEEKSYRLELAGLSEERLNQLHREQVKQDEAAKLKAEAAKREADEQARFFHKPQAMARIEHWAKAATWTLDEAIALSFGKDPAIVSWEHVDQFQNVSALAASYKALRDLVRRAQSVKQLYDPVLPAFFISWAKRMEVPFPQELEDRVKHFSGAMTDWKSLYERAKSEHKSQLAELHEALSVQMQQGEEKAAKSLADTEAITKTVSSQFSQLTEELSDARKKLAAFEKEKLSDRERDSLLKLVIGMAIDGYGHDPKAARSPTANQIASHLTTLGISLNEDTVRKYLQLGRSLLPPG